MARFPYRWLWPLALSALAALAGGCLELKQKLVLNADGSGEIHGHYTLTPAAVTALRDTPLGLYGAWLTPVVQPFPLDEAGLRALVAGEGLTLREVKVATTPAGGRQLDWVVTFANVRALARSPAAALCRFQLQAAEGGAATLQVKSLGLDFLDWRLPRLDPAAQAAAFADLQAAAAGLTYELQVQVPGEVLDGNAQQTDGRLATWTWRSADLQLRDVLGPDQALRLPTLRFRPDPLRFALPVVASPEAAVPLLGANSLRLSLNRCTFEPLARAGAEAAAGVPTRISAQLLLTPGEGLVPVAYETPICRDVITSAGENLAVPLPPLFGSRVRLGAAEAPDDLRRPNAPRAYPLAFELQSARQLDGLSRLRGSFVLFCATGQTEALTLPPVGQWPAAGLVQTTPSGRRLRLRPLPPGQFVIEYEPDADLEVQSLICRNAQGDVLNPTRRTRGQQPPDPPDSPFTRLTTFDLELEADSTVALAFYRQLRPVRVPFLALEIRRNRPLPAVTVEDGSGRQLTLVQRLATQVREVRAVAVTPDGQRLAAGGTTARLEFYNQDGALTATAAAHPGGVQGLAFLPGGQQVIALGQDRLIKLWDVAGGGEAGTFAGPAREFRCLALSADARQLLSGAADGTLDVWDVAARKLVRSWPGHTRGLRGLAVNRDGTRALSAGLDQKVTLWDVAAGTALTTFEPYKPPPRVVALSADGRLAAAGGDDLGVHLYDLEARREVRVYRGHANLISGLVFLPGDERLAASDLDGSVKLWEVTSDALLANYPGEGQPIFCLAAAGRRLIAGTRGGQVLILEVPGADRDP